MSGHQLYFCKLECFPYVAFEAARYQGVSLDLDRRNTPCGAWSAAAVVDDGRLLFCFDDSLKVEFRVHVVFQCQWMELSLLNHSGVR